MLYRIGISYVVAADKNTVYFFQMFSLNLSRYFRRKFVNETMQTKFYFCTIDNTITFSGISVTITLKKSIP